MGAAARGGAEGAQPGVNRRLGSSALWSLHVPRGAAVSPMRRWWHSTACQGRETARPGLAWGASRTWSRECVHDEAVVVLLCCLRCHMPPSVFPDLPATNWALLVTLSSERWSAVKNAFPAGRQQRGYCQRVHAWMTCHVYERRVGQASPESFTGGAR